MFTSNNRRMTIHTSHTHKEGTMKKVGKAKTGGNGKGKANKKQTELVLDGKVLPASKPLPKAAAPKKYGVCAFMADRLKAGDDTKAILDAIHKKFPESKATNKDVSIIRSKIHRGIM